MKPLATVVFLGALIFGFSACGNSEPERTGYSTIMKMESSQLFICTDRKETDPQKIEDARLLLANSGTISFSYEPCPSKLENSVRTGGCRKKEGTSTEWYYQNPQGKTQPYTSDRVKVLCGGEAEFLSPEEN